MKNTKNKLPVLTTSICHQYTVHMSALHHNMPKVSNLSTYQALSASVNYTLSYFMIGFMEVLSTSIAKSLVIEFLGIMSTSTDMLMLPKLK